MAGVRRLRGRDTHRHGELTFAQYQLLSGLESKELSAGELATTAELSPATVTQLLDSLAEMGLVGRTRSDRDRRVVTCTLTTHGRAVLGAKRAAFERRWDAALPGVRTPALAPAGRAVGRLPPAFRHARAAR